MGQGKEVRASPGQAGGKKLGLEISHFESEQGEEEKWAPLFSEKEDAGTV